MKQVNIKSVVTDCGCVVKGRSSVRSICSDINCIPEPSPDSCVSAALCLP